MQSPWEDESKVQQLRELWEPPNAFPVGEIAKLMKMSRGAVTSKAHRIGLEPRRNPAGLRMPKLTDHLPLILGRRGPCARATLETLESVADVVALPLPVVALRSVPGRIAECCWPLSEGRPWRFCEAPTVPGNRYCATHLRVSMHGQGKATEAIGAVLPTAIAPAATGVSVPSPSGESPNGAATISNASESSHVEHAHVITSDENIAELGSVCG